MKKYDQYKNSGVEWLGEIPKNWEVKKIKYLFKIGRGRVIAQTELVDNALFPVYSSQTQDNGILGFINSYDFDCTQITWTTDGANAGTIFLRKGKHNCTNVCGTLQPFNNKQVIEFITYSLQIAAQYYKRPDTNGAKIMNGEMAEIFVTLPPIKEQTAIANFLDDKTTKIDQAIVIKQNQIELLKERRQILIQKALTLGLNSKIEFCESGIELIGKIPKHWQIKKVKYLLTERNERSKDGLEPLFMMSQTHGLVVRSEYHSKAEVAQSSEGNKVVYKNDLVFNKLKAHLGVFFKSTIEFNGIVSPDYAVYYSIGVIKDLKFLELLFRNPEYIKEFICRATGIVEGLIRLYTADLFDIYVAVPPLEEQTKILEYIENLNTKIGTAISLKEQEIDKLKEYKMSLIDGVVTGKVKVC